MWLLQSNYSQKRQRLYNIVANKELQDWMDTSHDGVILFSLGSNIKVSTLEPEVLRVILATFAQLPQRVLMKWEGNQLPGKPENVRAQKWLPQAAVLGKLV